MKMKLDSKQHCMVVHACYPLGETRVAREALALVDAGHCVDVICLRDEGEARSETVDGIGIHRLPITRSKRYGLAGQLLEYLGFMLLAFFKLLVLFPRRRYAVVQVHNIPDFLVFAAALPKLCGAKLILDIHDIMPEFFEGLKALRHPALHRLAVKLVIWQERLSCRFADHVITVTDIWAGRLAGRGVPAEKVSVVMNVADERVFRPGPRQSRNNGSRPEFRLIYHGTFKRYYGMGDVIRAIGLARAQIPGIQVTFQGEGEFRDEMVRLVDELGLAGQVQISDIVLPVEALPALIAQADAGVVPNHNDGFTGDLLPTKMMEYVALGVPVIAARTRAISHYFDESMVQFFEPGDPASLAQSIVHLYRRRERLKEQVENSRRFSETYNWKAVSRRYVELVERLAGETRA